MPLLLDAADQLLHPTEEKAVRREDGSPLLSLYNLHNQMPSTPESHIFVPTDSPHTINASIL